MQKIVIAFAVFAVVTLYAISRGGDVDISSEAKGGVSYATDLAASAPSASLSASTPPAASGGDVNATLAKH